MLLGSQAEGASEVNYLRVDVETIYGIDTHREHLQGILLHAACGRSQYCHIHLTQLLDVTHHLITGQTGGFVLGTIAAHHTCHLHVGGCLKGLQGILAYVAIAHDSHSNLFHSVTLCLLYLDCGDKITGFCRFCQQMDSILHHSMLHREAKSFI